MLMVVNLGERIRMGVLSTILELFCVFEITPKLKNLNKRIPLAETGQNKTLGRMIS